MSKCHLENSAVSAQQLQQDSTYEKKAKSLPAVMQMATMAIKIANNFTFAILNMH